MAISTKLCIVILCSSIAAEVLAQRYTVRDTDTDEATEIIEKDERRWRRYDPESREYRGFAIRESQTRGRVYDDKGRLLYTIERIGNRAYLKDDRGRTIGTVEQDVNGRLVVRDEAGNAVQTIER